MITPKSVTVTADGRRPLRTTTENDVKSRSPCSGLGRHKGPGQARSDTPLADGMKLTVTRVKTKNVTKTTTNAYETIKRNDSSLCQGGRARSSPPVAMARP